MPTFGPAPICRIMCRMIHGAMRMCIVKAKRAILHILFLVTAPMAKTVAKGSIETSVYCHPASLNQRLLGSTGLKNFSSVSKAYTLMEILIVLVILGFILGFSGMRLTGYRAHASLQNEARSLLGRIQVMQMDSAAQGRARQIDTEMLSLFKREATERDASESQDIIYRPLIPFMISADGLCTKGAIELIKNDLRAVLTISAPWCDGAVEQLPLSATQESD